MKRVLKTRRFSRWMRKTLLKDAMLLNAVAEMEAGLVDADLGGGVFKKRVALPRRGKSGSVRTLIATNKGSRWIFLYGFEKNERDNITKAELKALQNVADDFLNLAESILEEVIAGGHLAEVTDEQQDIG
ncbi:MAG: type II toxin-antitoxin system RelE/ParE family toxin [Mailhella sp.]|nr:type II toxin-antitoxin system RelE/ParE family toxin [Mailhella sp.]